MQAENQQLYSTLPSSLPLFKGDDEGGLNLGQIISVLRRRIILIAGITTVVASAAVLKAITDTPTYSAQFEMLTEPVTVEAEVTSSIPGTLSSNQSEVSRVTLDATKIRVLTSPRVIDPIVASLQGRYPDINYGSIVSNLGVSTSGENILAVGYRHPDPVQVAAVLEAVAEAFLQYSLESRQSNIRQGINFVEAQLPEQRSRVDQFQKELQDLRQQYNLIDPTSSGQQLSIQMSTYAQQKLDVQLQLQEVQSLYIDLQRQTTSGPNEAAASSALTQNSRYQSLLDQLLTIDNQIAQASVLLLDDSPDIQLLRQQRQNVLLLLQREGLQTQAEVASQIRALSARNQILSQTIESLNQEIKQLSVIDREYTDIQRELKIATQNLEEFLAKRDALLIDAAQREVPWELLNLPSSPQPSSASVKRNAALGTILGLLLGVGGALLLEQLSNIIHTPKDIKAVTNLPLLGVIPFNLALDESPADYGLKAILQQAGQKFQIFTEVSGDTYYVTPFSEAFRTLYTNIGLLKPDRPVRSIVISSAAPVNGKSTTSTYLAQAAAAMGKRVLLVDTDLRRPQLHQRLDISNKKGLIDIIASGLSLDDVVQQHPENKNLFVLTVGQLPPDPTQVLASQRMHDIMQEASQAYDFIIYDTPPHLGLADALLLAPYTDGMVLVVGLGKLKRVLFEQSLEQLQTSGVSVLGVVANGSREENPMLNYYSEYA